MANVKLSFPKKAFYTKYPLEMAVDGQVYQIAGGASVDIELGEGTHAVTASLTSRGRPMGVADARLEIRPGMCYDVTYAPLNMKTGTVTVNEVVPTLFNSGAAAAGAGRRGYKNTAGCVTVFVGIALVIGIVFGVRYCSDRAANQTVTQLNAPRTVAGNQVTFTSVTAATTKNNTLTVTVAVTVKNVSGSKTISVYPNWKGYVDDVSVAVMDDYLHQYLQHGDLVPGKSTSGECYFTAPKDAKRFELVLSLGLYGDSTVTLAYDIPAVETTAVTTQATRAPGKNTAPQLSIQ